MNITFSPSIDDLYNIESDYDFAAALSSADKLMSQGETEEACQQRLDVALAILEEIDSAPEDLELDMNNEENHPLVELLSNCGLDHYYICDFEMAAAMFEAVLQLDSEDHFDVLVPLAYCYIAMNETDALDEVRDLLKLSRVEQDFFNNFIGCVANKPISLSPATKANLQDTESDLYNRVGHLISYFPTLVAAVN